MSKKDRQNELLEALYELKEDLETAIDAIGVVINEVELADTREEVLDAINGQDWDDLLDSADYIDGGISLVKDLRLMVDAESVEGEEEEEEEEEEEA